MLRASMAELSYLLHCCHIITANDVACVKIKQNTAIFILFDYFFLEIE